MGTLNNQAAARLTITASGRCRRPDHECRHGRLGPDPPRPGRQLGPGRDYYPATGRPGLITKTVDNPSPTVGDQVTFTVTLTNNGPNTATAVSVQDLLPAGLTFVSADPSRGTVHAATGVWAVGSLAAGDRRPPWTLRATVTGPAAVDQQATVAGADQFDPIIAGITRPRDRYPAGGRPGAGQGGQQPDPERRGHHHLHRDRVQPGPDPANDVVVNDPLPTGLTFVSATRAGTYSPMTGRWTGAAWQPAPSRRWSPGPGARPGRGDQRAVATSTTPDPDMADNTSQRRRPPAAGRRGGHQDREQPHAQRRRHDHLHRHASRTTARTTPPASTVTDPARRPGPRLGHPEPGHLRPRHRRLDGRRPRPRATETLRPPGHGRSARPPSPTSPPDRRGPEGPEPDQQHGHGRRDPPAGRPAPGRKRSTTPPRTSGTRSRSRSNWATRGRMRPPTSPSTTSCRPG